MMLQEDTAKLQQQVLQQLSSHIDPFDLTVFTPHLLSALERQLHRSTVRETLSAIIVAWAAIVPHTIQS